MKSTSLPQIDVSIFSKAKDLQARILFAIGLLIVYRLGSFIPLPGVDAMAMKDLAQQNASGVLGMFNMLSGGSLGRMSIFALSIVPYITSSIVVQLLGFVYKPLESLKKEGDAGRKKINQITKLLTIILCVVQSYGVAVTLENMITSSGGVVYQAGYFFRMTAVSSLTAGTLFLMWMGEQISVRGIGNGTSLIIFSGIVAGFPSAFISIFELGKTGALSGLKIFSIICITLFLLFLIVFIERSVRKIIVQYPKRQVGNKIVGGENSFIPIKINTSGVIPPIFAGSVLLFPITVINFLQDSDSYFVKFITENFAHGKFLYVLTYVVFITFFSFFYTSIIFNPEDTAENLRKYGGVVVGRRPGAQTAEYFDFVITRMTVIGALYLSLVCAVPEILISAYSFPFYLGGTSLLIIVSVVMELTNQVQSYLFSQQYDSMLKKIKVRGR
jgi:preprotein translocase subunit SecY